METKMKYQTDCALVIMTSHLFPTVGKSLTCPFSDKIPSALYSQLGFWLLSFLRFMEESFQVFQDSIYLYQRIINLNLA